MALTYACFLHTLYGMSLDSSTYFFLSLCPVLPVRSTTFRMLPGLMSDSEYARHYSAPIQFFVILSYDFVTQRSMVTCVFLSSLTHGLSP